MRVASVESTFEPIKESHLSRHLENGNGKPSKEDRKKKVDKTDKGDKEGDEESLARTDYQLYEALNLLKGLALQQEHMQ